MADITKLVDELSTLSVLEAAELAKALEEKWGVTAAAPMAMAMPMGAGAAAAEAVEEKTEFNVILKDVGPKKIDVIRVIRQITNLGLKDAKDVAPPDHQPRAERRQRRGRDGRSKGARGRRQGSGDGRQVQARGGRRQRGAHLSRQHQREIQCRPRFPRSPGPSGLAGEPGLLPQSGRGRSGKASGKRPEVYSGGQQRDA